MPTVSSSHVHISNHEPAHRDLGAEKCDEDGDGDELEKRGKGRDDDSDGVEGEDEGGEEDEDIDEDMDELEEKDAPILRFGPPKGRCVHQDAGVVACTFVNNLLAFVDRPLCTVPMVLLQCYCNCLSIPVLYTPPRSPSRVRAVLGQSEHSPSITYYLLCSDSTRTLLGLCCKSLLILL